MRFSTWLAALTEKTTPADGDLVVILDSAASNAPKKIQKSNLVGAGTGSGIAANGWEAADAMTYASADDPTYTVTISGDQSAKYSAGMRIKLTQSTGGTKYFIITKVAVSTDTTLTLYGGTDYDLANEAISNPYYSVVKAPAGFPLDPAKWTVSITDTTNRSQATPTASTWYNLGGVSLSIPIGCWNVSYGVSVNVGTSSSSTYINVYATISTANNTGILELTSFAGNSGTATTNWMRREGTLTLAAKTTYYLNTKAEASQAIGTLYNYNDLSPAIIRAVCAYL